MRGERGLMKIGSTKLQLERAGYSFTSKRDGSFVFFINTDLQTKATVFVMDGNVQHISFTAGAFYQKYSVTSLADLQRAISDFEMELSHMLEVIR